MMAFSTPLRVFGVLCCARLAASSEGLGSPVALVQSGVRVHHQPATSSIGRYLMDNSELQHSGPGVLLRRSKDLDDTAGRDKYVKWGSLIEGEKTEDGWVKYQGYYLPVKMRGAQVLTEQVVETALQREVEVVKKANVTEPQKRRFQPRFKYAATEFQTGKSKTGESIWANCDILRAGQLPDTYDITVRPRSFAPYNITGVPASSLKKVQKVRQFTAMKSRTPKQLKLARQEDDSTSMIKLMVNDTKGNVVMDLKMMKKSPMRTVMKMACERARISWFKCEKKVNFVWQGNPIHPDDSFKSLGLESGHTILMVK